MEKYRFTDEEIREITDVKLPKAFKIVVVVFLFTLILQFIPAKRSNVPTGMDMAAPDTVVKVMRRTCYDCHSQQTQWPWYSAVSPISVLIAHHVNEGRRHLDFSTWNYFLAHKVLIISE